MKGKVMSLQNDLETEESGTLGVREPRRGWRQGPLPQGVSYRIANPPDLPTNVFYNFYFSACMSLSLSVVQGTTGSHFSPSAMWVPGMEHRLSVVLPGKPPHRAWLCKFYKPGPPFVVDSAGPSFLLFSRQIHILGRQTFLITFS